MKPSDKIWLEPECDECDERCWSCAPFDDCEECGKEATGYVRDDIVLASTAEASRMFDRIKKLEAALREMLDIVATHRVYVGNSPAGELACEWTMDAIKEIHTKMEEVLAREALEGKDD